MANAGAVAGAAAVDAVAVAAVTLLRLLEMVCCVCFCRVCFCWLAVGLVAACALVAAVLTFEAKLLVLRCGAAPWRMLDSARGAGLTRPCSWVSLQSTLRNSRSAIG